MPETERAELKGDEPSAPTWATAIPELFYDVVARILPGFFFISLMLAGALIIRFCFVDGKILQEGDLKFIPASLLAGAVFFWSWTAGLLLTFLGGWLSRGAGSRDVSIEILRKQPNQALLRIARREGILPQDEHESDSAHAKQNTAQLYQDIHEYLKARRIEWRSILSKNQAEVTFYENITAALVVYLAAMLITAAFLICAYWADASILPALRAGGPHWIRVLGAVLFGLVPQSVMLAATIYSRQKKYRRLWERHISILRVALHGKLQSAGGRAAES
ncbi:MAG TPA: hypothetical protein VN151_04020 [Terracidiphilus sp.]|nr:hypothetical protein [Terracidiphilus sp.]